jgi:hypothetical protein
MPSDVLISHAKNGPGTAISRRPEVGDSAKRSPSPPPGPRGPAPPTPAYEGASLGPGPAEASGPLAEAPGAGLALGFAFGFEVGLGVGFVVGFGFGVGLGVGRGVGVGLGGRLTTTDAGLTLVNEQTVPFGSRALKEYRHVPAGSLRFPE